MASREERIPTEWLAAFAAAHGYRADGAWDGNDFHGTLLGGFGPHDWELKLYASLDTDYAPTQQLRCAVPAGSRLEVDSANLPGRLSGTEIDIVAGAIGAARKWLRSRRTDETATTAQPDATPRPGATLNVDDPAGLLAPDLLQALESWPAPTHARSNLTAQSLRLRHAPTAGVLTFDTVQHWGPEACAHLLGIAERVVLSLEKPAQP